MGSVVVALIETARRGRRVMHSRGRQTFWLGVVREFACGIRALRGGRLAAWPLGRHTYPGWRGLIVRGRPDQHDGRSETP